MPIDTPLPLFLSYYSLSPSHSLRILLPLPLFLSYYSISLSTPIISSSSLHPPPLPTTPLSLLPLTYYPSSSPPRLLLHLSLSLSMHTTPSPSSSPTTPLSLFAYYSPSLSLPTTPSFSHPLPLFPFTSSPTSPTYHTDISCPYPMLNLHAQLYLLN